MDSVRGAVLRAGLRRLSDLLAAVPLGGAGQAVTGAVRQVVRSGVGTTAPFLVTVIVLGFVLDFVAGALAPFVALLDFVGLTAGVGPRGSQLVAVGLLAGLVLVVGLLAELLPGARVGGAVERSVTALPGVGSVYTSFDRMSDALLDADAESFQEVKLIEFPQPDTYALAFVTADGPASVTAATEEAAMQVLFVPMAPNPVMGGYMVCVPTERVLDVDMTVPEAFQAIVTSGVAVGDREGDEVVPLAQ